MLTDFARDHAFTVAWFGVMAFAWLGWGQEDPKPSWRWKLGAGSGLGLLLTVPFVWAVIQRWSEASALEGRYHWFGVLVLAEVIAAGVGAVVLLRHRGHRWVAWWIALVVALHFLPLAWLLSDPSLIVLGVLQVVCLLTLLPALRRADWPTSRLVCPVMGGLLLLFAVISAVLYLVRYGSPF